MKFHHCLALSKTLAAAGLLLASTLACSHARAAEARAITVKTSSSLGGIASSELKGSGILFAYAGKAYVLTSEHVVYHSSSGTSHSVWNPSIGNRAAKLTWSDWGTGLALLELPKAEDVARTAPGLEIFASDDLEASAPTVLAGFPHRSNALVVDRKGHVLTSHSDRHLIPLVPRMIEILGGHGEYGMSGGPALDPKTGAVSGMLSHQAIEMVPGGPAQVTNIGPTLPHLRNHVLLIPSSLLLSTLASYFANPSGFVPAFTRVAELQSDFARTVVESAGLVFEVQLPPASGGSGGGDGVGIGGGDGVGIGGGDGVGIGGSDRAMPVWLKVSLLPEADGRIESAWAIRSRRKFHENMRRALLSGKTLSIRGFVRLEGNMPQVLTFRGIESFFSHLARSSDHAVIRLDSASSSSGEALVRLGAQLAEGLSKLEAETIGDPDSAALISGLRAVADLAQSIDPSILTRERIRKLEEEHPGWDAMFIERFDETVELMRVLRGIGTELAKLAL